MEQSYFPSEEELRKEIKNTWQGWRIWVLVELALMFTLKFIWDFPGLVSLLKIDWVISEFSRPIIITILAMSLIYISITTVFVRRGGMSKWVLASVIEGHSWDKVIGSVLMGAFILPLDMASEGAFVFFLASGELFPALALFIFSLTLSLIWVPWSVNSIAGVKDLWEENITKLRMAVGMEKLIYALNPAHAAQQNLSGQKKKNSSLRIAKIIEELVLLLVLLLLIFDYWKGYIEPGDYYQTGLIILRLVLLGVAIHLSFTLFRESPSVQVSTPVEYTRIVAKSLLGTSIAVFLIYGFIPITPSSFHYKLIKLLTNAAFFSAIAWIFCLFWRLIFRPLKTLPQIDL